MWFAYTMLIILSLVSVLGIVILYRAWQTRRITYGMFYKTVCDADINPKSFYTLFAFVAIGVLICLVHAFGWLHLVLQST